MAARMSRYSGKNEPAHYMLKIESFSLLSEAKTIKFESDVFEAAGYKWSAFNILNIQLFSTILCSYATFL